MVFCSDNVCLMLVEFNLNCEYVRSNDGRIAQSVERSANNAVVLQYDQFLCFSYQLL